MAAPRRYTPEQREAMFQLRQEGMTSADISRACEQGIGSVDPFQIPRRTVHEIVTQMEAEAESSAIALADGDEIHDFSDRMDKRIKAILERDIAYYDRKVRKGKTLSREELGLLGKIKALSREIQKSSRRRATVRAPSRHGAQGGSEDALDQLARRMQADDERTASGQNGTAAESQQDEDSERDSS